MPPPRKTDKRRHARRAKSIRFRFDHAGDQHRAVSTVVSLGGAFLKASHIPRAGTILMLLERFNPDGVEIALRCEVVWKQAEPSLERPETGFGVRFIEAMTHADPSGLEDFLRGLDPTTSTFDLTFEERSHGALAVYRFPLSDIDPSDYRDEEHGFAELDEPAIIDLHRELERLGREERKISRETTPTPTAFPPPSDSSPTLSAVSQRSDSASGPLPAPADRSKKKRRVTGIFTALFTRGPRSDPSNVDQPTPERPSERLDDDRRPRIQMVWSGQSTVGRLESLGRLGATLWSEGICPDAGVIITLRPIGAPPGLEPLSIAATVTSREDRVKTGVTWLSVSFTRVDEAGRPGRFQDYLELVNGPGDPD